MCQANCVNRFVDHTASIADFDLEGIQIDNGIHVIQRPGLPGFDLVIDRMGHRRNESSGDLCPVNLLDVFLDLQVG